MNALSSLHQRIDDRVTSVRKAHPDWLCGKGCDTCCRQLAALPQLTRAEWKWLREGLATLPSAQLTEIHRRIATLGPTPQPPVTCPLLDPASQPGRIRAFFVEPSSARQGLGSMLMRHCERQALAAGFTALDLAATLPGVPLYLASGFAVTEDFYLDLPDNIKLPLARMHKRL